MCWIDFTSLHRFSKDGGEKVFRTAIFETSLLCLYFDLVSLKIQRRVFHQRTLAMGVLTALTMTTSSEELIKSLALPSEGIEFVMF